MPKKCASCRHFQSDPNSDQFERGFCTHIRIRRPSLWTPPGQQPVPINRAREICDKEGDGIFVHFEPKTPAAGFAFAQAAGASAQGFTIAEDLFYPHTEIEGYQEGDNDDFLRGDL